MEARPFAGFNPRPSPWGYNWTTENASSSVGSSPPGRDSSARNSPVTSSSSPEPQMLANQYINMPAALLNTLKREKKPFTYTPGGVNLSEVLNARLQKRLERKKRYSEEHMNDKKESSNPVDSLPKFEPPKQVIVMPTYNSPLDMYSMENALEALEVQAELVAADKSLSAPSRSATLPRNHTFRFQDTDYDSSRGVAQSKAFRVLQIITDTEDEPSSKDKTSKHQDEMRFTGIRESKEIPSKFFHNLQKITGTAEDDEEQKNTQMNRVEAPKSATFEKQPSRPGFMPQPTPPPQNVGQQQNHVTQFQPMSNQRILPSEQPTSSPALKRPAAFLPMKTGSDPLSRIKPVHPPFLANGPRRIFNPSAGTDF